MLDIGPGYISFCQNGYRIWIYISKNSPLAQIHIHIQKSISYPCLICPACALWAHKYQFFATCFFKNYASLVMSCCYGAILPITLNRNSSYNYHWDRYSLDVTCLRGYGYGSGYDIYPKSVMDM